MRIQLMVYADIADGELYPPYPHTPFKSASYILNKKLEARSLIINELNKSIRISAYASSHFNHQTQSDFTYGLYFDFVNFYSPVINFRRNVFPSLIA